MTRVAVEADLLRWARERAGEGAADELSRRFPKLPEWEAGAAKPTLNQLEAFARAAHVPVGYLFLPQPPEEHLPISDFRTHDGRRLPRPSPNLLDMIYACQERQDWYREFSLASRLPEAEFVGSATLNQRPEDAAAAMSARLRFDLAARAACRPGRKPFGSLSRRPKALACL